MLYAAIGAIIYTLVSLHSDLFIYEEFGIIWYYKVIFYCIEQQEA